MIDIVLRQPLDERNAIMGGLVVARVLTLLALPAMYAAWFRVKPPEQERAAAAG